MQRTVSEASAVARSLGQSVHLVGGAVRDLVLRRPLRDLDLVLEREVTAFAAALADRLGARVITHERFGTATLELPGGAGVDVAATRRETYAYAGALPTVSPGATLEEDLARRDFTIHAMALEISPKAGVLRDPFGGRSDLDTRRLRFLHPASPTDDPTRAFRAVRYANRLGFRVAPEARRQIAAAIAIGAFDAVSGDRLRREVELLFAEPRRGSAVAGLIRLGLDGAISPALARAAPGAALRVRALERLATGREAGWLGALLAWMGQAPPRALGEVADRLAVSGREGVILRRWASTRRRLGPGIAKLAPSGRRRRAEGFSADEVLAAAALRSGEDRRALAGLAFGEELPLTITGADLLSRGVPQGPDIGRALEATRAAREDGRLAARDELAFALARVRRNR